MSRSSLARVAALALTCAALAGCTGPAATGDPETDGTSGEETAAEVDPLRVRTNLSGDGVDVDALLKITASGGSLRQVAVTSGAGRLAGKLARDGSSWSASGRLEPGQAYDVRTVGTRSDGKRVVRTSSFETDDLTLDEQTYASVAPLDGETVGVGMPVTVSFDVPVTDRASMEHHMSVSSTPQQAGRGAGSATPRRTGGPGPTGRPGRTSRSTSTSTACPPAAASTARRTERSTSRSATPTSTRSTWTVTRCVS